MRTTLDIDDAVLSAARALASEQKLSIGAAVSQLAMRGLTSIGPIDFETGFPTFVIDRGAPAITPHAVNEHRD